MPPKPLFSSNDPQSSRKAIATRPLSIDEIRLVADLRVMHSKVDELYQVVNNLKRRHDEQSIHDYSDREVLEENIRKVDEIYLWYVALKDRP